MPDPTAESLFEKRGASLLAKWAAGKRLTPQEREEIAGCLPQPPPVLALEAQVEGGSDKQYQRGREDYSVLHGQSIRTINRWMARKAPLDAPSGMATWWAANMKHRVPAELLRLAEAGHVEESKQATSPVSARPAVAEIELSPLDQAREMANTAFARLREAQAGDDEGKLALAQRAYASASEQLRRVELADPKIRAQAGAVVDKENLRMVLSDLHTSIAQGIRSFCKRMRREADGEDGGGTRNPLARGDGQTLRRVPLRFESRLLFLLGAGSRRGTHFLRKKQAA